MSSLKIISNGFTAQVSFRAEFLPEQIFTAYRRVKISAQANSGRAENDVRTSTIHWIGYKRHFLRTTVVHTWFVCKIEAFPRITTKAGAAKIFGILIATGGAIIMNFGKSSKKNGLQNNTSDALSLFGYLALLSSTMCSAFYIVLQKKYIFSVPTSRWRDLPISVTAWAYFFGAVFSAITSLYYANRPDKFHMESAGVLYTLIYAVFVTSALCYMFVTWCNMQVSAPLVSAAVPLQVFFCVIISYIVLGETVSALEVVGGLMIIFALLSVVWSNYQDRNMVLDKEELILPYSEQAEKKLLRNKEENNEEREPNKI
ncbi:uncharacterized protein LOC130612990 [Hydractinia symbiolongicarpus]|uniref:uncharacterized protein LOC130612990 n=1 Tax=Hydractinia symbiolongicarpus TaxID=13093 RepID=UPI00254BDCD0|nr:uncharacterized protein LOC130612990 [Hydractinia symbiolongicarpus]